MNAPAKITVSDNPLDQLRAPFPAHQISKLPKESRKQADERKAGNNIEWNCSVCGGMHHAKAVHLDYVGHAALTDRLLDVDPCWTWEPLAIGADGLPAFDRNNGLWIKLTVHEVTRLGYGAADGKQGGDAIKEIIGDALRNAAMRFGAALNLWHKGELHAEQDGGQSQIGAVSPQPAPEKPAKREAWDAPIKNRTALHKALIALERDLLGCGDSGMVYALTATQEWRDFVATAEIQAPHYLRGGEPAPPEFEGIQNAAERLVRELDTAEANHMADLARSLRN